MAQPGFDSGAGGYEPVVSSANGNRQVDAQAPPALEAAPTASSVPEGATPIKGPAARLAQNMVASLGVPTATSFREIDVAMLEARRGELNQQIAPRKASFTHLIGWAIVGAVAEQRSMSHYFTEIDGQAYRVDPGRVNLGLAVDVERRDGSRFLVVPVIKAADAMDFAAFQARYEELVEKARTNKLSPDDFATGATVTLTMTVTSTYDHRIIQGAESGLFLARIEELLRGEDSFYERIFEDLKVPHRPIKWEIDENPGLFGPAGSKEEIEKQARVLQLINAYRVRGHLVADLDPLDAARVPHKDLDPATYGLTIWDLDREFITNGLAGTDRLTLREILEILRDTYCSTIGVEYMFIADRERKAWLQVRMESCRNRTPLDTTARRRILEKLVEAESFERFLHAKYVGHKRFSLEGCEATIPLLDRVLSDAARSGVREVVMGMAHRGRLNVLANTVGKPLAQIFSEFEGNQDPNDVQGSGDVKYHLGATGVHEADTGETLGLTLAPNPSHLEWVDPVVEGMVRAKQDASGDDQRAQVMPVLLHGDAAFAGQGIVAETLNLAGLEGYTTGGTVHVVINNQIGFTTAPTEARSSTYATDVAKMVQAPILHVNGDDPEAVWHVAALAFEYRQRYKRDVVIDLVGYRRWGHNETDEPSYTQPLMYAKIKGHTSVAQLYGDQLVRTGVITREELDRLWNEKKAQMQREGETGSLAQIARRAPVVPSPVDASAMWGRLRTTLKALSTLPEGLEIHPKLMPFLKKRADLIEGKGEVDWATGESLAWGTLLLEGVPVRVSGQDSGRGTFSQRHAGLYDVHSGKEYVPLQSLAPAGVRFEVLDSLLSEAAVMGFEFGYAVAEHRALVMWEAQFGDFFNGAQVIVDQFLAGSEEKWGQPTGLVLLLPHGHEGQGPEHSSARIERFLTLCAEDNMRVCYPSTPASYFHLLRRQGRDPVEKPLVVFTPKSLLRHPRCVSSLPELAEGKFEPVLDDAAASPSRVRRIVMVSGKLYYDLLKGREDQKKDEVALVRVEEIYPFPAADLRRVFARYSDSAELVWAQEEPRNMGAWRFVREQFLDGGLRDVGRVLRYVGREESASPAPGSHKRHVAEQEAIVAEALRSSVETPLAVTRAAPASS